ncbi:MAG: DUF4302 domain-containing protein [Muribaculaceae bacterium]|nr:DUF4302 domain-containing protein [Muribaculaceae bacterium]
MKKFQVYGALMLLGASVLLTSCFKNEEDDIFDKSASERLDDAKVYYSQILTDKGGKWQLEYYANGDEHGYVYLMTFNNDGRVTISGQNEYIGYEYNPVSTGAKVFKSETSLWEVVGDNGPVLSLNSYNRTFHIFASPYDIPPYGEQETDESGEGHEGDYEFDLMKYSNDTLYVEGKKRQIKMIMTRVDANIDDQVYMNYVTAMADSFFHPKFPIVFLNLPNGKRYGIKDGATQIVTMWDFDKDRISYEASYNAIVNHDGFSLMDPFTAEGCTVQRFVRQSSGALQSLEDPSVTVDAGALNSDVMFNHDNINKAVLDSTYISAWTLDAGSLTGNMLTAYNAMKAGVNKGTRKLGVISIEHAGTDQYNDKLALLKGSNKVPFFDSYVMVIRVSMSSTSSANVILPLVPKFEGEEYVTLDLDEPTTQLGQNLTNAVPELANFIALFRDKKFKLSAVNSLAPTVLTMALADDAGEAMKFVIR